MADAVVIHIGAGTTTAVAISMDAMTRGSDPKMVMTIRTSETITLARAVRTLTSRRNLSRPTSRISPSISHTNRVALVDVEEIRTAITHMIVVGVGAVAPRDTTTTRTTTLAEDRVMGAEVVVAVGEGVTADTKELAEAVDMEAVKATLGLSLTEVMVVKATERAAVDTAAMVAAMGASSSSLRITTIHEEATATTQEVVIVVAVVVVDGRVGILSCILYSIFISYICGIRCALLPL